MIGGYRHYGITGQTISVRPRELDLPSVALCVTTTSPWTWAEHQAKVVQETDYFLTVEIQPIYNRHGYGWSRPYNTSIHKHDIATGEIIIKDIAGKRIR